jgi:hypothetical protein
MKTATKFESLIKQAYNVLKDLEGLTVTKVYLLPVGNVPEQSRGLFQYCPVLAFECSDQQTHCFNLERLLSDLWNAERNGELT